jgi:opacity protein-like surface antigen
MIKPVRSLACAAFLACAFSTPAAAQLEGPAPRSNTAGFNLGVFLNGSGIQMDGSDVVEAGRGGSLHLGYGLNQTVSVFARANAASIATDGGGEDYTMAHFDLGARLSFGQPSSALRPFVQGAVNGRAVSADMNQGTLQARGAGLSAGLGLEYFVNPTVAVEAGLSYSFGKFSEGRLGDSDWVEFGDESFEATSARFDLGLSFHP